MEKRLHEGQYRIIGKYLHKAISELAFKPVETDGMPASARQLQAHLDYIANYERELFRAGAL